MSLVNDDKAKVLVAAGGTGGHVFPALAVCEVLQQAHVPVVWVGTAAGLESKVVPEAGIPMHLIDVVGWRGKPLIGRLKAPFLILSACFSLIKLMRKERIAVVLGLGGFVSAAAGITAALMRRPLLIQEQNAVMGSTNRLLRPFAKKIFAGFPAAAGSNRKAIFSGNPVRRSFVGDAVKNRQYPHKGQSLRLLIVGGSLGARPLNNLLPKALMLFCQSLPDGQRLEVVHQTGKYDYDAVNQAYLSINNNASKFDITVTPFISDVAGEMEKAHLMIGRAGALSVSECLVMGLPAILVPLPHAIDDHQTANAQVSVDKGAAIMIQQADLNEQVMASAIERCVLNKDYWLSMSAAAQALARPDAANVVAKACIEYANV